MQDNFVFSIVKEQSYFDHLMTYLSGFTIVRLGLSEATGEGPIPGVALGGRSDFGAGAGPEPAVHIRGLQIGAIATREVAFTSRCPDKSDITASNSLLYELVLLKKKLNR